MAADMGKLLKSPIFWIKVLEWLVICLMIALTVNGGYYSPGYKLDAAMSRNFVVFGTQYAWLIINTLTIIGFIMDERLPKKLVLLLSACAAVLFVTAGALELQFYDTVLGASNLTLGAGVVGVILGAIFIGDTFLTFKFD